MSRRANRTAFLACVAIVLLYRPAPTAQTTKFQEMEAWARLPKGMEWGAVAGTAADAAGNVYAFRRAEPPILEFDKNGAFVRTLGAGVFSAAHGLRIDRQGMIWAADVGGHVVYRLDPNGKILLTLGTKGVSGQGPDTFNGPTDVLVTPAGDVFVTDGSMNHRVVHFSPDGTFIGAWGTEGTGPGQFKIPHSIAMDTAGRVFVADRDNARIEIFDQRGTFLDQWTQFGVPSGLFIDASDTLYVATIGEKSGLVVGSARTGKVDDFVPIPAKELIGPHHVTVDSSGTVYVSDLLVPQLRKFRKVANAVK